MTRRALITGVAGQDGTYLTELLLGKGYQVFGVVGPEPGTFLEWAEQFDGRVCPIGADLTDMDSLLAAVDASRPDEVYNFAARSSVGDSFESAIATTDVNAVGVVRILEALRRLAPVGPEVPLRGLEGIRLSHHPQLSCLDPRVGTQDRLPRTRRAHG